MRSKVYSNPVQERRRQVVLQSIGLLIVLLMAGYFVFKALTMV